MLNFKMNRIQMWSASLGLTVLSVAIAYQWLDRPIAFFAHDTLSQYRLFAELTHIPEWLEPVLIVTVLAIGLRALIGRALTKMPAVMLVCALSLLAATAIKNQLKFIFGRTWPETWTRNNPSLIHDGVYGFNPFHGGIGYESFPSGHTTAICALMSVLWICYPKFRIIYASVIGAVIIGLIGADYHFFSDIIAGAFVGTSVGWIAVVMWNAGGPAALSPGTPRHEIKDQPQA